jgi:hypothetical protein
MFDYYDTEAAHLEDIYSGFEGRMSFEEEIAEAEYQRANTLATLAGLDEDYYTRQRERRKHRKQEIERKDRLNRERQKHDLFVIIQDSRKDDTTLMLVDRRKSKQYWWTHDFSLAYKGCRADMDKVASRLKKNKVRVVNYNEYLASV